MPVDTAAPPCPTGLKSGLIATAPPPTTTYWPRNCNHRQTVKSWQHYLPGQPQTCLFSLQQLVGGDSLADFYQACSITRQDQQHWPEEEDGETFSYPTIQLPIELIRFILYFPGKQLKSLEWIFSAIGD